MSWQIGDLAVCIDDAPCPDEPYEALEPLPTKGNLYRVAKVAIGARTGRLGIMTACGCAGYAYRFRKIKPDEQEACEPEFVKLLKRSKVSA